MIEGGIEAQTAQVMKNEETVMKNAGLGFENVARTTVFLTDIADFQAMNKIYAGYFPEGSIPPALHRSGWCTRWRSSRQCPSRRSGALASRPRGAPSLHPRTRRSSYDTVGVAKYTLSPSISGRANR
jgi:hypothetical protein